MPELSSQFLWLVVATLVVGFLCGSAATFLMRRLRVRWVEPRGRLVNALRLAKMVAFEHRLDQDKVRWFGDTRAIFGREHTTFSEFQAIIHPDDRESALAAVRRATSEGNGFALVHRIILPGGNSRWVTGRGEVVRDDLGRRPPTVVGVIMDVDESQRALLAAEQLQAERAILDAAPGYIWFKDRNGRIVRVNQAAAAARGLSRSEIEGHFTSEIYPDEAACYYGDDLEVMTSGQPKFGIDEQLSLASGEKRWIRTDKTPYRDADGNIVGVVVFSLDITDLKATEAKMEAALAAARAAERAKDEFLAMVSHELRTPFGVMTGFAELLTQPNLSAQEQAEYAEKILRNGRQLTQLIDELLDIAKLEQGRLSISLRSFSLRALLADVASMLGPTARAKGLDFRVEIPGNVPDTVISDPDRLRQILVNVLGNAVKFTEQGSVEVKVEAAADGVLAIDVRDTGCGMPETAAAGLFQPFFQGDPLVAKKYGGSGLGLALSRRLSRALGGDLELVRSEAGVGSTFRVTLRPTITSPAPQPGLHLEMGSASGSVASDVGLAGKSVLLVEDNPDMQQMIRSYFRGVDVRLTVSGDGRSGVDAALDLNPDLVLMDLQLPELDGMAAIRELQQRGFRQPVVAMTAHAMPLQREACLSAGFSGFLAKPLARLELLTMVRQTLEGHSGR